MYGGSVIETEWGDKTSRAVALLIDWGKMEELAHGGLGECEGKKSGHLKVEETERIVHYVRK